MELTQIQKYLNINQIQEDLDKKGWSEFHLPNGTMNKCVRVWEKFPDISHEKLEKLFRKEITQLKELMVPNRHGVYFSPFSIQSDMRIYTDYNSSNYYAPEHHTGKVWIKMAGIKFDITRTCVFTLRKHRSALTNFNFKQVHELPQPKCRVDEDPDARYMTITYLGGGGGGCGTNFTSSKKNVYNWSIPTFDGNIPTNNPEKSKNVRTGPENIIIGSYDPNDNNGKTTNDPPNIHGNDSCCIGANCPEITGPKNRVIDSDNIPIGYDSGTTISTGCNGVVIGSGHIDTENMPNIPIGSGRKFTESQKTDKEKNKYKITRDGSFLNQKEKNQCENNDIITQPNSSPLTSEVLDSFHHSGNGTSKLVKDVLGSKFRISENTRMARYCQRFGVDHRDCMGQMSIERLRVKYPMVSFYTPGSSYPMGTCGIFLDELYYNNDGSPKRIYPGDPDYV